MGQTDMTNEQIAEARQIAAKLEADPSTNELPWCDSRFDEETTLKLVAEVVRLRALLTITRGQWIHSVNAEQCMIALGWEAEWREIQAGHAEKNHG